MKGEEVVAFVVVVCFVAMLLMVMVRTVFL